MINLYRVGGSVRDELMGVKSKDIDFSVEVESFDDMRNYLLSIGAEIFLETPEYFTIRAKVPGIGPADYVLCRREGAYYDGRHPESVEPGNIYDDLARRDFTMNAIAIRQSDGMIIDPYNGQRDIQNSVIRCVRNTLDRFNEDPLRILRALRFAITKNMIFCRDIHTFLLFNINNVDFGGVSIERKREELHKMFSTNTIRSLELIRQYDLEKMLFSDGLWLMPTLKDV